MMTESRPNQDLIVVVRVPKSASTSLSVMALRAFPQRKAFVLPNTVDLDGSISVFQRLRHARHALRVNLRSHRVFRTASVFDRLNRCRPQDAILTGGHIDFETCRRNLVHRFKMVTLVRDPVDRSLSEYHYARAGFLRKASLAKFDASLVAKAAGTYSYEGYLDFLLEHRPTFGDIACRFLGWNPATDIENHFAEHVYHFGVVDDLQGFSDALARKTGDNVSPEHLNFGPRILRSVLSAPERRKIEALYPNDIVLYDWCRRNRRAEPRGKLPLPPRRFPDAAIGLAVNG